MLDLNAKLFYKAKFEIAARNEQDLLWNLVLKIRSWMVRKWDRADEPLPAETAAWSRFKMGGRLSSEHQIVNLNSCLFQPEDAGAERYWACRITESRPPKNGFAPRDWTTEVGFQQTQPNRADISVVLSYSDRPGFIGPCEAVPEASVPNLLKLIFSDRTLACSLSGLPLSLSPTLLHPGDFPAFWQVVSQPDREVPVVYLSPRRLQPDSETAKPLLEPDALVKILGPNALVYYAEDLNFSREMTRMCPVSSLGCYGGAVRIYSPLPRLEEPEDGLRHRFLQAAYIDEVGADAVMGILRRALAQDVHFYESKSMFRVEDCKRLRERADAVWKLAQVQQEAQAAVQDHVLSVQEDALQESLRLEKENLSLQEQLFQSELEKDELSQKLYCANAQADAFRTSAQQSDARERALDRIRAFPELPTTPRAVVEYFLALYPDRLAFTKRGWDSLKDCKTQPDILWQVLYDMCTLLYNLYTEDSSGAIDQEFTRSSRFRMGRGEGKNTHQDKTLMQQYQDQYDGRAIDIQPHIATNENQESSPRFLRVHFCYDSMTQKIVVGSCGRHLDNSTTRKIN